MPDVGVRLAGEREYSFKHVLIRDVAYGMLPKAVRARKHFDIGRFLEDRAGERTDEVVALLAEHFGRAAILTTEGGMEGVDAEPIHRKALQYLEGAGDAAAALYSNPEAFEHYEAAQKIDCPHDPGAVARVTEKQGDVAFRMGRVGTAVELWEKALEFHRQQEDLTRVADLHRKIGAGLWNRGERKLAIERYQKGINLLKDGPPCLELVHLYEEAASLYMHAGDNMLAIYASEKALRLAEKLQETRVASRAHGIFGRVFGRIGDTEKARENLERSVELARDSDDGETIRALLTLGPPPRGLRGRLRRRGAGVRRGAGARAAGRRPSRPGRAAVLDRAGGRIPRGLGRGRGGRRGERRPRRARRPGREALLPVRAARRAGVARRALGRRRAVVPPRARAGRAGGLVRGLLRGAVLAGARAARQRRLHGGAITELDRALDVCERAGLIAQSIEAMSARAITLVIAGKREQGREAAEEAGHLADRLHYPVGSAAALMAMGTTERDPAAATRMMTEARELWDGIGRPLDAAITDLLLGHVLVRDRRAGGRTRRARPLRHGVRATGRGAPGRVRQELRVDARKPVRALCQTFPHAFDQATRRRGALLGGARRRARRRRDRQPVLRAR